MAQGLIAFVYLLAAVCFILALRGLSHPKTSRQGNLFGMAGMALAILATLATPEITGFVLPLIAIAIGGAVGAAVAWRIDMTQLPQLVAAFHSLVGLAAVFVALAAFYAPQSYGIGTPEAIHVSSRIEMAIGAGIGAITFTGSIIAFTKLAGIVGGTPLTFRGQHMLNLGLGIATVALIAVFAAAQPAWSLWLIVLITLALGFLLILPIGGADMPVVVSMLNSYSGWAAAGIGFTLTNNLLIITGALVGSSGAILSYIMCKGMNRSFINVILGGFGGESAAAAQDTGEKAVTSGSADDAGFILGNAGSVVIVPGYGMAVGQAQHALREMADILKAHGVSVRYAIHPVAGRMPGHMNVLLAEANVPYEDVYEMEEINRDFQSTDVAFVIGANDITNPAAQDDPASPIYGMPILNVADAKTVLFVKRSLAPGYAGIDNSLFYKDNTMMLFGDAKQMVEGIVKALEEQG
ncbi:NAD(P) transhydrogenase subunit beta [Limimonas halophila]|uniref:NAD(P) transhydrogenase subunit beta n=1 Tax=Limimonas halophila TaxID=1082479 RepID=A0A1G7LQA7_9PROT|nr:NAD(P)(+) transhydrogenase (Re/Si-specific) subunit beta [Limimonas halophila]SDF51603.1 NAD(P) transhydrogenase subunit beta [Limimonas halophila]